MSAWCAAIPESYRLPERRCENCRKSKQVSDCDDDWRCCMAHRKHPTVNAIVDDCGTCDEWEAEIAPKKA